MGEKNGNMRCSESNIQQANITVDWDNTLSPKNSSEKDLVIIANFLHGNLPCIMHVHHLLESLSMLGLFLYYED